ncbi:hypothetical protein CLOSBL3_12238 [Clostridiaceae bacterium BL-3]|nr:hypothetical protein CLOSBL3_12238 [Clostridiaceae bacterium BL-3]
MFFEFYLVYKSKPFKIRVATIEIAMLIRVPTKYFSANSLSLS